MTPLTKSTKSTGTGLGSVQHQVQYQSGYQILYVGRPSDRTDTTPAQVVNSTSQIVYSGTFGECDRFLAAKDCRRM